MLTAIKNKSKLSFNIRKAAYSVIVASWVQIIAAVLVAVLFFMGANISTAVMIIILIPLEIVGNYMLMRNSWNILDNRQLLAEMQANMEVEADLNRKLRSQRHDFINHLQVVYSLMELEEYNDAKTYLKKVYDDIRQIGQVLRTANSAVNALLAAKAVDAQKKNVKLMFHISAQLKSICTEDWQFCRVLSNLLDNAIYYAARVHGEVHLTMREGAEGLYFSVENEGDKIPEDNLGRIFEAGFTTKGDDGTGMGLYIVKETLEEYGGSIGVQSDDQSTRFFGFLPAGEDSGAASDS